MIVKPTVDIGDRLELFVDRQLIERLAGVTLRLHRPRPAPLPQSPLPVSYATVIRESDRFRAYYRDCRPGYAGKRHDGHPGEIYCYAESLDGQEWTFPELNLVGVTSSRGANVILAQAPYCHNFSPFLDSRPGVDEAERYKALAGTQPGGLYAFSSGDGIRWRRMQDGPAIACEAPSLDSQNVSFWSAAEGCYVCYLRTWVSSQGALRTISRALSADYVRWSEPVPMNPNLPGEHLYTSNTHPYFRAPHLYIALPTRFVFERGQSTDILFMSSRAGSRSYDRLFPEAIIRPGFDPRRWGNRSNYVALNVVPTAPTEMSVYHKDGHRYVWRTDGFVSVVAGATEGELLTKALTFTGNALVLNCSTSAAGQVRVEIQDANGGPVPGFAREDCTPVVGDGIKLPVRWSGQGALEALAGRPVRLRFTMMDCDLYSFRFQRVE